MFYWCLENGVRMLCKISRFHDTTICAGLFRDAFVNLYFHLCCMEEPRAGPDIEDEPLISRHKPKPLF